MSCSLLMHAAGAVAREEEAEDHTAPLCCPLTFYQLAPWTPWSALCTCIQGHHILGMPRHGQYMIISWHLENHHPLSGFESYGQVVQCLVDNAYRGLHSHCPVHTSALFKAAVRLKSVVTVPQKSPQARGFLHDERCERGVCSKKTKQQEDS